MLVVPLADGKLRIQQGWASTIWPSCESPVHTWCSETLGYPIAQEGNYRRGSRVQRQLNVLFRSPATLYRFLTTPGHQTQFQLWLTKSKFYGHQR